MRSIIVFLILVLFSCDDNTINDRHLPRIETEDVLNINENGVTFRARILDINNVEIVRHGFTWSEEPEPFISNHDYVVSDAPINEDFYELSISTGLKENTDYYVRTFVETDDYLVYGLDIEFTSINSNAPTISSFSPLQGSARDVVTISGSGFSWVKEHNIVSFNNMQAIVISATATELRVVVPQLVETQNTITVSFADKTTTADTTFEYVE